MKIKKKKPTDGLRRTPRSVPSASLLDIERGHFRTVPKLVRTFFVSRVVSVSLSSTPLAAAAAAAAVFFFFEGAALLAVVEVGVAWPEPGPLPALLPSLNEVCNGVGALDALAA